MCGVKGKTRNGHRDPKCPSARRIRMVREDTGAPNKNATCVPGWRLMKHPIGGLIGCWLGISVWAFDDIIEKAVLMATDWTKKFRKKKQDKFEDAVFHPTHITFQ
ncbi:hypothetical protein TNCV_3487461 [Trichonephila clavipes]|nr:hypothetical protein TNCV_3487461 [Trichonephila clavipes]